MRPYVELALAEFRRYSTYRMAMAAGIVTQSVFGFLRASILLAAVAGAGGHLQGYDAREASTYVWIGQAILAAVSLYGWVEIADRVKSGDIAVDIARPLDLMLSWWARDLGRAALLLGTRGLPPLCIGAITIGLAAPPSWTAYPLGAASLVLAISVSFLLRYAMNLLAFWFVDIRGFAGLFFVIIGPLSGLYVPVHLFPDWLRTITFATPFPAAFQSPIDVLSGRVLGWAAIGTLGVQGAWVLALVLVGRLVSGVAARKLVVQGG